MSQQRVHVDELHTTVTTAQAAATAAHDTATAARWTENLTVAAREAAYAADGAVSRARYARAKTVAAAAAAAAEVAAEAAAAVQTQTEIQASKVSAAAVAALESIFADLPEDADPAWARRAAATMASTVAAEAITQAQRADDAAAKVAAAVALAAEGAGLAARAAASIVGEAARNAGKVVQEVANSSVEARAASTAAVESTTRVADLAIRRATLLQRAPLANLARSVRTSLLEGALAENSEGYASLFTYHPHATYSVDRSGHYTDANPRALAMTGLSLQQMRETHFAQVIHPEDAHIIQEGFDRALAGDPNWAEARVLGTDGQVVDIRCTMIPVVIGGEIVGVHGVTEDITDAKQVLHQLEEANAAKALFLANVSHEVRTPLTSVIGATELLMDADLEPEPEHLVRMVHRSGQRLMHLVEDILDFSRLEARQVVLRLRPFGVREIVEGVAEWAVPCAGGRNLTISFAVDESVPTTVIGDGLRVSQVVTNLVQNAIKFTECGSVDVRVSARTVAPDPHHSTQTPDIWVEFTVTDTGIGIAENHLNALFEPFTQADPSATRGHEGIGLGLAICRDLVDLMGGQLRAFSTVGEGSTFTFGVALGHFGDGDVEEQGPVPAPRPILARTRAPLGSSPRLRAAG